MRLFFDECLPIDLRKLLTEHEVHTASYAGFSGLKNGDLIRVIVHSYDVLITLDRNMQFQQNLENSGIAVVVMKAHPSTLKNLEALIPKVKRRLLDVEAGKFYVVD